MEASYLGIWFLFLLAEDFERIVPYQHDDWRPKVYPPTQQGKEKLAMNWMMLAVIGILAVTIVAMTCGIMRLMPSKRAHFDDVKIVR